MKIENTIQYITRLKGGFIEIHQNSKLQHFKVINFTKVKFTLGSF